MPVERKATSLFVVLSSINEYIFVLKIRQGSSSESPVHILLKIQQNKYSFFAFIVCLLQIIFIELSCVIVINKCCWDDEQDNTYSIPYILLG